MMIFLTYHHIYCAIHLLLAKETTKVAVSAATTTAGAVGGAEGMLIGAAAGKLAGMKIDNSFAKVGTRNRILKFLADKNKDGESKDSVGKLLKDLIMIRLPIILMKVKVLLIVLSLIHI